MFSNLSVENIGSVENFWSSSKRKCPAIGDSNLAWQWVTWCHAKWFAIHAVKPDKPRTTKIPWNKSEVCAASKRTVLHGNQRSMGRFFYFFGCEIADLFACSIFYGHLISSILFTFYLNSALNKVTPIVTEGTETTVNWIYSITRVLKVLCTL